MEGPSVSGGRGNRRDSSFPLPLLLEELHLLEHQPVQLRPIRTSLLPIGSEEIVLNRRKRRETSGAVRRRNPRRRRGFSCGSSSLAASLSVCSRLLLLGVVRPSEQLGIQIRSDCTTDGWVPWTQTVRFSSNSYLKTIDLNVQNKI